MSDAQPDRRSAPARADDESDPILYPANHVVGILDSPEEARCTADALAQGGFLESEFRLACGLSVAERLHASTGRTGLLDRVIRIAQSIGITHDELEVKNRYEQALRDGSLLAVVLAPTDERKTRAAGIVRDCGGHFINFLGRFTREEIVP